VDRNDRGHLNRKPISQAEFSAVVQECTAEVASMWPVRISFVTYNLWKTERWQARAPALARFLKLFAPDILCVQELRRTTQKFLDATLTHHDRVRASFAGWTNESNIYWKTSLFRKIEHGAEQVGHLEPQRRLFWTRLQLESGRSIFVATAHLTPPRHPIEAATGRSPRVRQLNRIAGKLERLVREGEPAFFMGDMNDARHPQPILKEAGFTSCFAQLGMQSPPTSIRIPRPELIPASPPLQRR
jgi:endonuclease/exonuclease/phosphatase family metal-dependent hydrolase